MSQAWQALCSKFYVRCVLLAAQQACQIHECYDHAHFTDQKVEVMLLVTTKARSQAQAGDSGAPTDHYCFVLQGLEGEV